MTEKGYAERVKRLREIWKVRPKKHLLQKAREIVKKLVARRLFDARESYEKYCYGQVWIDSHATEAAKLIDKYEDTNIDVLMSAIDKFVEQALKNAPGAK